MGNEMINIEAEEEAAIQSSISEMAVPFRVFVVTSVDEAEARKDEVYKSVKKEFAHPGYRTGNVPRSTVERAVGRESLYRSVLSDLVRQAATDRGVDLVAIDKIIVDSIDDGEPIKLSAIIYIMPSVELPDYKNMTIDVPAEPSLQEDVLDGYMREMLKNSALTKREDVEAEIKEGDFICIDYEPVFDKVPESLDPLAMSGTDIELYYKDNGSLRFVGDFEEAVGKLVLGETSIHDITFPENYPQQQLAGELVSFKFTLKAHQRVILPDELAAAKEGGFDSFDEWKSDYRTKLQENITSRYNNEIEQTVKMKTEGMLLEQAVVSPIPEPLIAQEASAFLARVAASEGTNSDKYLEEKKITFDDFMEDVRMLLERKIRLQVIFSGIANAEEYVPSTEDEDNFIADYAKVNELEPDVAREAMDPTYIVANLRIQKGYDVVRESVKIDYV